MARRIQLRAAAPLKNSYIDVGGYRRCFILHQMTQLLAAYAPTYQHADLVFDVMRLEYDMTVAPRLTQAIIEEYEDKYKLLVSALEQVSGCQLVLMGDMLQFKRQEEQHEQEN